MQFVFICMVISDQIGTACGLSTGVSKEGQGTGVKVAVVHPETAQM